MNDGRCDGAFDGNMSFGRQLRAFVGPQDLLLAQRGGPNTLAPFAARENEGLVFDTALVPDVPGHRRYDEGTFIVDVPENAVSTFERLENQIEYPRIHLLIGDSEENLGDSIADFELLFRAR